MAREQSILADTSGIIALLDRDDQHHTAAIQTIQTATILVPSTVLPEVDYLVSKYLGEPVARAFLEDLIAGCFTYLNIELEDIQQAVEIMMQYNGVPLGLVDASLIAVAVVFCLAVIMCVVSGAIAVRKVQDADLADIF